MHDDNKRPYVDFIPWDKISMQQPAATMSYYHRFESIKQGDKRLVLLIILKRYSKKDIKKLAQFDLSTSIGNDILKNIERHTKGKNIIAYQHYLSQFDNENQGDQA